ncbi:MAG: hypothetical protein CMH31_05190 [Micavibrio sp.]|nr:hypothetical protein [Micavibrio sp.]|tara:strand:+ start:265 stop:1068 length:804 start_codon:yes stop_codon:yes gene_type:complete
MSKKKKQKKSFLVSFLKKVPWVIGFAIIFMILSLKAVERFPQPLKEGIQGYLEIVLGQRTSITKLEKITFFPDIYIQMKDLVFSDSTNVALTNMTIGEVKAHIPFLNTFTAKRNIYDFEIHKLDALAGVITPHKIIIDVLDIVPLSEDDEKGKLFAIGKYAEQPLSMNVRVDHKKTLFGKTAYRVPKHTKFSLTVGDVTLNTDLINDGKDVWFRNGTLEANGITQPIKDSSLIRDKAMYDTNIVACLLEHDYKNTAKICDNYMYKEE